MSMIHRCAFHRVHIFQVQLFVMMVSLKNHILFFQILSIIVDTDPENEALPNVMDCRFGRSIIQTFIIILIPRITNELAQKLKDFLRHVPI